MITTTSVEPLDVVVIGAGQAGLAIGHHLARRGCRFEIVDAASEVGHSWRTRWDSLRLFSPAEYDGLPGLPFPAPAGSHPGKDEVADYLRAYAEHFDLPVRLSSPVTGLHRDAGLFTVSTPTGTRRARQVVVATGPFQTPYVPSSSADAAPEVQQLHSAHYRNPAQIPAGSHVLVVGAANSGLQIADGLAAGHAVTVAVGSRSPELPQRILGRDLFFWLSRIGFFTVPAGSRLGRRLRSRGDLVIGSRSGDLRRRGVRFAPRLTGFDGRTACFADRDDHAGRRGGVGHRLPAGLLLATRARCGGQRRGPAPGGCHRRARFVLPRAALADRPGVGSARLRRPGRGAAGRAHGRAGRRVRRRARPVTLRPTEIGQSGHGRDIGIMWSGHRARAHGGIPLVRATFPRAAPTLAGAA